MDPNGVVLDISSDEEVGWGEPRGISDGDDHNWLSELLHEVEREADDSEDVVLVGENVINPKQRLKPSLKDFDDDCVILDGDPDKPVAIQNDDGVEFDDLLVVSEKGQVACRDYPHSRHLCVTFPFSSTPHESRCDQCHCYVCDSLAPCVYWGTGSSSSDHCHATDKEEFWRQQRKIQKNGDKVFVAVPKVDEASLSTIPPQTNQVPPASTPLQPIVMPRYQALRPTSIRVPPVSTNFGFSNIYNQSRNQCSRDAVLRNKFQPNLVSQQLVSTCNSTNPSDRRHSNGSLGPRARAAFKRTGLAAVGPTTNQCSYGSHRGTFGSHYSSNPPPVVTPSNSNPIRWQDFNGGMISESNTYFPSSQPHAGNIFDSVPSQTQVYLPPNMGIVFEEPGHSQTELSPQPNLGAVSFQRQVSPQLNLGNLFENPIRFQSEVSPQPNYQVPPQPQMSSQPNYPVPSQPQVNSLSIPASNYCQNISQQGNQTQSAIDSSFIDSDFSWLSSSSLSHQPSPAENSQIEVAAPTNESSLVASPGLVDFQYDSWTCLLDLPIEAGTIEIPSSFGLNELPPAPIDTGILFDF